MPLLKFHMYEGKSEEEITKILDVTHDAMVKSFNVPNSDRYQLVHEHKKYQMVIEDTGLDYERTDNFVLIHIISRTRTEKQIKAFYANAAKALEEQCGIKATDLMFSISPNNDEDWSFGEGKAQFLTGDLK
ncbi:tautomerase family protein [Salinicoccus roseus]|uniref:tautomerase family protein n=1 Tax=Salinicoccus roseus TaxID=45670 RepID=UPI001CA769BA|nr:tautomerase family protein [Salinicoccus roseus]MBY8909183.1 tautomerase family protein [Salinicoccus roseus]